MAIQKFRTDINGLRAIAVMLVVLFHFSPDIVPGGFVGVDIFFVISGYLMTSMIYKGVTNNSFSLISFYSARFKRIVPALMFMIALVSCLAYLTIGPHDFQKIGIHGRNSLLFISNITYYLESGYFDVDSLEKFFLHTWSLSVEWQFYLIYPIVILVISKSRLKSYAKPIIGLFFFASYIASLIVTKHNPSESYFMLHTRAWEMMAGGLAFFYPLRATKKNKSIIFFACALGILASAYLFDSSTPWPGHYALFPVFLTAVIISINHGGSIFYDNQPIQKIGLWSYSIYLFHWPVIVFSRKYNIELSLLMFSVITLLLSCFSYYLIEKRRLKTLLILPFYIALISICQYLSIDGASSRVSTKMLERSQSYDYYYNPWMLYRDNQNTPLMINAQEEKEPKFILTGDSFAFMYVKAMEENGIKFEVLANESCNTSMFNGSYKGGGNCINMKNLFKNRIMQSDKTPVIVSQSWDIYLKELSESEAKTELDNLMNDLHTESPNRTFYILGTYHQPSYNPYTCMANNETLKGNIISNLLLNSKCAPVESKNKDALKTDFDIDSLLEKSTSKYDNIQYISMRDAQCDAHNCTIIENGEPLIVRPHLTIFGAHKFTDVILKKISN